MDRIEAVMKARELAPGERRRELRQRAGLSLADVARRVGRDRSTVSRWETKGTTPRGDGAARYMRLLARLAKAEQG